MAASATCTKSNITLRGSTDIVADFFMYGINSILYQRGLYPPETFSRKQEYGITLLVTTDDKLKAYLSDVLGQVKDWLFKMTVQKLVLVVRSIDTNEPLERWQFDVQCDKTVTEKSAPRQKTEQEVKNEIRNVIKQITASVSFLPLLETACVFDILVYTDKDLDVPVTWGEAGPALIDNSQEVRLRSFTTSIHKVDGMVAYKYDD